MQPTAADIWRDYNISTVPASGPHQPVKKEIRAYLQFLQTLSNIGAGFAYPTLAAIGADLIHPANTFAIVYNDATPANNGMYAKSGVSGSGSWTRAADLPTGLVPVTVTGGTANAIIGTAPESPSSPAAKLYVMTPTANCTGASTLALNGAAAVPIKMNLGADTVTGSLVIGSPVLMTWQVDHYQLMISVPVDATGVLNDVLAAKNLAVGAAAALGNQAYQYDTVTQAIAASTPAGVNSIVTHGLTTVGDGGRQEYIRGTSTGPGVFQDALGAYWNLPVVYNINGSQAAAAQLYTTSGITVAAGKTYTAISIRQQNGGRNTATIGAGAQFDGIYVDVESLSGSDASSNCYALIAHSTNSGAGITKAIHAAVFANTGSTGVLVATNIEMVPVATTNGGSSCIQLGMLQNTGVADGIVTGINVVSADLAGNLNNLANNGVQFNYVIGCPLTTVPVKSAFLHWAPGSTSAANARFTQLFDPVNGEIHYIKKTGEVVSAISCIGGGETLGTQVTVSGVNRIPTNGALVIAAGSVSGVLQLQAGGNTGLQINANGSLQVSSASIAATGSVAWSLGSVGPAGANAAPQGALTFKDNLGTTRYVPFF